MRFTCMGNFEHEILANDRNVQDNAMKKIAKRELDGVTRDPQDLITELELLRGNLQILVVIIDDV